MSVRLEALLHHSVCCHVAHGEEYRGQLEALDGTFDVVLSQCTRSRDALRQPAEPLVFVRGEHIIYIGFDETSGGAGGAAA
ncbi:hypothetical protein LSCM4_08313 [Leishmania orientalis]|uniref:Sm domain-containing protein n=1 Tax=Leishmania orientalis TaxID=2249476 RepID=A0A836H7J4_9TRYP|nr:hypothetical protein LSCM4_08313 [Leishmania orientalis]